jgi:hypothetical protein
MNPFLLALLPVIQQVAEGLLKAANQPTIALPPLPTTVPTPTTPVPPPISIPPISLPPISLPPIFAPPANIDVLPDSLKPEATGGTGGTGAVVSEALTVDVIQRFLNVAGAQPPLDVDGRYGPKTEAALQQLAQAIVRARRVVGA